MLFKFFELLFLYEIVKLYINVKLMRKGKKLIRKLCIKKLKFIGFFFLIEFNKVIRLL